MRPILTPTHLFVRYPYYYPGIQNAQPWVIDFPWGPGYPQSQYEAYYALGDNIALRMYVYRDVAEALGQGLYKFTVRPFVRGLLGSPASLPSYLEMYYSPTPVSGPIDGATGVPLSGAEEIILPTPVLTQSPEYQDWYYFDFYLNIRLLPGNMPSGLWPSVLGYAIWSLSPIYDATLLSSSPYGNAIQYSIGARGTWSPMYGYVLPSAYSVYFENLPGGGGGGSVYNPNTGPINPGASDIPFDLRLDLAQGCDGDTSIIDAGSGLAVNLRFLSVSSGEGGIDASIELFADGDVSIAGLGPGVYINPLSFLAPELGVNTGALPALVVTEVEEQKEFDPDTRTVKTTSWKIGARLTVDMLTRQQICCEPCLYPYDPVAIDMQAISTGNGNGGGGVRMGGDCFPPPSSKPEYCLERYIAMRRDTDAMRPQYQTVKSALELVYDFSLTTTPLFGKVPFVDPPAPEDTNYSGMCSYADLLSRAFGWADYMQFIGSNGKVILVDGTIFLEDADLDALWGPLREVSHATGTQAFLDEIRITTGPIGDYVEVEAPSNPNECPPPGPGEDAWCEGPSCTFYMVDETPGKTVITVVEKMCDRVISERTTTYEEVYISAEELGKGETPIASCWLIAITDEVMEYTYSSPSCSAPVKKVRTVYKTDVISDLPDWVRDSEVRVYCTSLEVPYYAEKSTTSYKYDERGCLMEETTEGYKASIATIEFEVTKYSRTLVPKVEFAYEPVYEKRIHVHYGEGKWLHRQVLHGGKGPTAYITPPGRFLPLGTARMGASEYYGRTVVTNEEPQCYECASGVDGRNPEDERQQCKLGTASSSIIGLGQKEYIEQATPPDNVVEVRSVSANVEMINSYWPIRTQEVNELKQQYDAVYSSIVPERNPCTGEYEDTTTIANAKGVLADLYPSGIVPYDWQSLAQQVANYLRQRYSFGTRTTEVVYDGYVSSGFPRGPLLAGVAATGGGQTGIVVSTRLSIEREQQAHGLVGFKYQIAYTIKR